MAINEKTFYNDAGPQGAVITHFFSTDISYISKSAWDSIREGYACISADDLKNMEVEYGQLCSSTPCDKQTTSALNSFFLRQQSIADKIKVNRLGRE